ncbi:uncharacterized protein LOC117808893 [Xyrichtys novacula]|uniref:Uncharacterized protein LOC117808893 n=1 Tax=Xyrichtys novacula TaxID=13765 RepID=A0AAV1GWH2_XYRNO|nr:uncharacterized protein LOC117808893 [Xyrichtys novacula]
MGRFRNVQVFLFLTVLGQLTAGQNQPHYFTVQAGDEVVLPCKNMINTQHKCNSAVWIYDSYRNTEAIALVKDGQIIEQHKDRLNLTDDCSLLIKKVDLVDTGRYDCKKFISEHQLGPGTEVHLSVAALTTLKGPILHCGLLSPEVCSYTVRWLYVGEYVDEALETIRSSPFGEGCLTSSELSPSFTNSSDPNLLICEVTNGFTGKVQYFNQESTANTEAVLYTAVDGDNVTLSCGSVTEDHHNCNDMTWTYTGSEQKTAELVKLGQVGENTGSKSDRLGVTANCSLVVKKVRDEDVGRYICHQNNSGQGPARFSLVYLSVVTMAEQRNNGSTTLICSVSSYGKCMRRVTWLFEDKVLSEHHQGRLTPQHPCFVSATFQTHQTIYKLRHQSLQCGVTIDENMLLFPFRVQAPTEKLGEDKRTEQTESTAPSESSIKTVHLRYIIVTVGLSALIIIVVMVNIWTKTKVKKSQRKENQVGGGGDNEDAVNDENIRSSALE